MESQSLYQDVPPTAPAEKSSLIEDFVDVFYAPSKVFDRRRDGRFGAALGLLVLMVIILYFATRAAMEPVYDATMDQQMQAALRKNPNMPEGAMEGARGFGSIMMGVGIVLGTPFAILATGVLLFIVARLFDLKPTFSQAAMIATFANVPRWIASSVVSAIQAFAFVTPENPKTIYQLALSPARTLAPDANPGLLSALMRVEVFTLWATILLGIGLAVVCRTDRKKGILAAFVVWFVAGLLQVAMASAGAAAGG